MTRETYWVRVNRLLLDYSQAVRNSAFCIGSRIASRHTRRVDNMNLPQQRMPETADEIAAAVFSECLMTLVRTAAMLLGKVTAPATGEPVQDLTRVQLVIQQLELLEKNAAKLSLDEQQLLKQSLQELRMAYVSAAGQRPRSSGSQSMLSSPPRACRRGPSHWQPTALPSAQNHVTDES